VVLVRPKMVTAMTRQLTDKKGQSGEATLYRAGDHAGFMMTCLVTEARTELPEPRGQVILTISGLISETNIEDRAEFDAEMLQRIGMVDLATETPWTEGTTQFSGVPFGRLLDAVGPKGSLARAVAANDYAVDIPITTLRDEGAILAMRINGKDMTLREKGPLWIIFPWSDRPELDRVEIYNLAIWQLLSLHIQ